MVPLCGACADPWADAETRGEDSKIHRGEARRSRRDGVRKIRRDGDWSLRDGCPSVRQGEVPNLSAGSLTGAWGAVRRSVEVFYPLKNVKCEIWWAKP